MTRRYRLQGIVLAVGLLAALLIALLADRDTGAWSVPPLVLTLLLVAVITLADGHGEQERLEEAGRRLGLRHQRSRTLPPVTPVLEAVRGSRVVQALEGELEEGGPPVRLAVVRAGRARLAVCLTDLEGSERAVADPHGLLEGASGERSQEAMVPTGHATGDDALVVFAAARRGEEPPFEDLLAAARQLRPALAR